MTIYPAIDIKDGKCVRLTQGDASRQIIYFESPMEAACLWKKAGASWVHVVDLDGAFSGKPKNLEWIKKIAGLGLAIQFGGGLRDNESIEEALKAGASRVVLGTRACSDAHFVRQAVMRYADRVAVGIDAKNGKVAVRGWTDVSEKDALALADEASVLGVGTIIYTDIATDGTLQGPNFQAQIQLMKAIPNTRVIASGGISCNEDVIAFMELSKTYRNFEGLIIGKALYEGRVDPNQVLQLV